MTSRPKLLAPLLAAKVALAAAACAVYEAPPRPTIEGLASGVLSDPRAPLVIDFGTPVELDTLSLKVALLEADLEGNLRDEDADPETELRLLVRIDPLEGNLGARAELEPGGQRLRLVLDSALPVGAKLVLIVEGGLRSRASGRVARYRIRVPFSYVVRCATRPTRLPGGSYFVLLDVEEPLGTQIQLLASIAVDPASGALVAQFANADRDGAQVCPSPCPPTDVCRLRPAPECVPPSTKASAVDEYPDFVPNVRPPTGYALRVEGCAADDGPASGVLTAPAVLVVAQPKVTVEGLTMSASFAPGPDGAVRGSGSLTADVVRLGTTALGPGRGTMTAIRIPDDRVPPDLPPATPPIAASTEK